MNILIIGNGFDLAHGLPTYYMDYLNFIKYCVKGEEIKEKDFKRIEKVIECFQRDIEKKKELNELVDNNKWINYFILKKDKLNENWIDFEREISLIIQALDKWMTFKGNSGYLKKKQRVVKYFNELGLDGDIEKFKVEEIKSIIELLYNDLNNLIKSLEIYLYFIEKININTEIKEIKDILLGENSNYLDGVLSFNYTNTFERIYKKVVIKSGRFSILNNIEYEYIHGKINLEQENNMVLGIDEYLDNNLKDSDLEFVQFKKYYQRIYKETGRVYGKWINDINDNEDENNVYIFGHSLDFTDKDILKKIISCKNKKEEYIKVTVFYHNEKSHRDLIKNIIKIIGQDEMKDRFHSGNQTIVFKKLKEETH